MCFFESKNENFSEGGGFLVKRNLLVHRTQIGINSMLSLGLFCSGRWWVGWLIGLIGLMGLIGLIGLISLIGIINI